MRFFTWNSQGDFTDAAKKPIIESMFNRNSCSVGFIQEGGVGNGRAVISAGVTTYGGSSVGARNERCTNYVLVKNDLIDGAADFECFNAIGGGEAGRTAAAVRLGDTIYASWHSLSGPSNADTSSLLDECLGKQGVNAIVIGGDFNTSPDEIENVIIRKAARGLGNFFCMVMKSENSTYKKGGGKELDFFVVLHNANVNPDRVFVRKTGESDHHAVIMSIDL